jgi:hypothetical protein
VLERPRVAISDQNVEILRRQAAQAQAKMLVAVSPLWNDLATRREQLTGLNDQIDEAMTAYRGAQIDE